MDNVIEFNKPVHFDGDIIITDPCYITKDNEEKRVPSPCWWDYITINHYDGYKYHYPKPQEYPDARLKTIEDCHTETERIKFELKSKIGTVWYSKQLKEEEEAYNNARYYYYEHESDWDDWVKSEYGENLSKLGFTKSICTRTIYGDWSCTVDKLNKPFSGFNKNYDREEIGEFCADAGKVCVLLADELKKYNSDFDWWETRPWTTTLIKNFHGEVQIATMKLSYIDEDGEEITEDEDSVFVIGTGNINFIGYQSGF